MRGSSRTNLYVGGCTDIAWNTDSNKYVRSGKLDGNPVQVLLDTGSTLSMVRADHVQSMQLDNQWKASVQCVYGDSVEYPTTKVQLKVGDWGGEMQVAVAPDLPVPILMGKDVFHTSHDPESHGLGLLVETRAQKRKRYNNGHRKESPDELNQTAEEIPGVEFDEDLFPPH